MYSTSLLSRFMQQPTSTHVTAAKRILRYLKGSLDYGVVYYKNSSSDLKGYTDSDWAGSNYDSKSTFGFVFSFGSGAFCWNSKKQEMVAQSSAEAEYISIATASNQVIWLRKILLDVGKLHDNPTVLWVDNQSSISMAKNPIQHGRTKHIKVKYHSIREAIRSNEIKVFYCCSEEQIADIMIKSLPAEKFLKLRAKLGVFKLDLMEVC